MRQQLCLWLLLVQLHKMSAAGPNNVTATAMGFSRDSLSPIRVTGFDCTGPRTAFRSVDLTEAANCDPTTTDYFPGEKQQFQILYRKTELPVSASRCQVLETIEVHRCGFNHLTYGSQTIRREVPRQLHPDECREAVRRRLYHHRDPASNQLDKVYPLNMEDGGHFQLDTYFPVGWVDSHGGCGVGTFTLGGTSYRSSYVQVSRHLVFQEVKGLYLTTVDRYRFGSHIYVKGHNVTHLPDGEYGMLAWEAPDNSCRADTLELHLGEVTVHRSRLVKANSIAIIEHFGPNEHQRKAAALELRKSQKVCSRLCFATHLDEVYACWLNDLDKPEPVGNTAIGADLGRLNTEAGLAYQILTAKLADADRLAKLRAGMCQQHREVLATKLEMLSGSDNQLALLHEFGPGHTVLVTGQSAHVARCDSVQLEFAHMTNCTQEIPVKRGNDTLFVHPITRILQPSPTIVTCSAVTPIQWKIAGRWLCASPTVRDCRAPTQLSPTSLKFKFEDFTMGLGHGVVNEEEQEKHLRFQFSVLDRQPVQAFITYEATHHGTIDEESEGESSEGGFGSFFGIPSMESLKDGVTHVLEQIAIYGGIIALIGASLGVLRCLCEGWCRGKAGYDQGHSLPMVCCMACSGTVTSLAQGSADIVTTVCNCGSENRRLSRKRRREASVSQPGSSAAYSMVTRQPASAPGNQAGAPTEGRNYRRASSVFSGTLSRSSTQSTIDMEEGTPMVALGAVPKHSSSPKATVAIVNEGPAAMADGNGARVLFGAAAQALRVEQRLRHQMRQTRKSKANKSG